MICTFSRRNMYAVPFFTFTVFFSFLRFLLLFVPCCCDIFFFCFWFTRGKIKLFHMPANLFFKRNIWRKKIHKNVWNSFIQFFIPINNAFNVGTIFYFTVVFYSFRSLSHSHSHSNSFSLDNFLKNINCSKINQVCIQMQSTSNQRVNEKKAHKSACMCVKQAWIQWKHKSTIPNQMGNSFADLNETLHNSRVDH